MSNLTVRGFVGVVFVLMTACFGEPIPDGLIKVENDTQDSTYNVISVVASGVSASLHPGQHVFLRPGTTSFSVSRRYRDFTRRYSVSCPVIKGAGIRVRLIDIHVNRIAGGCKTTSASR